MRHPDTSGIRPLLFVSRRKQTLSRIGAAAPSLASWLVFPPIGGGGCYTASIQSSNRSCSKVEAGVVARRVRSRSGRSSILPPAYCPAQVMK